MAIKGQLFYFPLFRLGTENSFFFRHEKKESFLSNILGSFSDGNENVIENYNFSFL